MAIRFFCSHCRQLLKAREDKIGRRVPCPKCKKPVTVPKESDPEVEHARQQKESEGQIDPFAELIVYDDEIVYETDDSHGKADAYDRRLVAVSRRVLYGHAVLLALVTGAAFLAGFLAGHVTRVEEVAAPAEPQRVLITGQLKWEASTGDLADKGAVVIAFPETLEANKKLPGEELSPARPMPSRTDELVRTIEDWGGDYKRTNDAGDFELFLKPGKYHVLLVSQQSERPRQIEPDRNHLAAIGRYFTSPEMLIGPYRYRWTVEEFHEDSELRRVFSEGELE